MGHLKLLSRKLPCGYDDFTGLGYLMVIRLILSILLVVAWVDASLREHTCFSIEFVHLFFSLSILHQIIYGIIEGVLSIVSYKSTMHSSRNYDFMSYLLLAYFIFIATGFIWIVYLIIKLSLSGIHCVSVELSVIIIIYIVLSLIDLMTRGCCGMLTTGLVLCSSKWLNAILRYTCYCFTKNNEVYESVANTIKNAGIVEDATFGDIVAALGLVRQLQIIKTDNPTDPITHVNYKDGNFHLEFDIGNVPRFNDNIPVSGTNLEQMKDLAEVCKYACCVYGWTLYSYKKWTNFMKLTCGSKGCCCVNIPKNIVNDNHCTDWGKLTSEDIIYANLSSGLYRVPFVVAIDHIKRRIIIAVRGTLDIVDLFTDLEINMENVDDLAQGLGLNADGTNYIHKGVLYTAKTIYDELENECPCLPVLLKGQQLQYPFYHPNINVDCTGYDLMLTGHSLGASTACVLSLLLYRDYPNLKCYLYEPVGCTMTLELAKFTEKYTISTVFGNDVIPRLSPHSIERLIASMSWALAHTETTKYHALQSWFKNKNPDEYINFLDEEIKNYDPRIQVNTNHRLATVHGYIPGKIIHIRMKYNNHWSVCGKEDITFRAHEACRDDFQHIVVSKRLMDHHNIVKIEEWLNEYIKQMEEEKPPTPEIMI